LLEPIMQAFRNNVALDNLLLAPEFVDTVNSATNACREAVVLARMHGLPCPAMSAALDYIDSYRTERLPANLIQGQRDYFGAHTYKRTDRAGTYHANWETGETEEIRE
jgi:6-phosphogluconate dehydrogenase